MMICMYSLYQFYGNDLCIIDDFVGQFIVYLAVAYYPAILKHTEE